MNDLINKIQSELPGFSKGQKQIARYILEHYDKAAFMTASRLGTTVGVSESTVVRFATELGYDGYPHLQRALQEMIRNKLTSVQRMEVSSDRMGGRDVLQTVLHADMDMIRQTLDELDRDAFQGAVDALIGAKRIYILGVRSSSALSNFLGFYFNLLFENVRLVHTNSVSEIFEQMLRIGPGDVVFGVSFPRYSKRTLSAMQYARDRGARVIALTDSRLSPLARVADHLLLARSDMASFVDSLVAPLSVVNALIAAVGMSRRDEIEQTFNKLERIWEEYDVYEKLEDDTN
ncbi:MurR/RpiR family transcriptional regulator [Agathobaculum desmolans]|uniref:MurR/RpiR family transcriptional regulator n=1 Tax=Agathobaculum desmolans TaxID=39484 RepID=UPI0004E0FE4D|nr:MurR/RpiR family transcriptional regulator [Agathobaculum desmolans]